MKKRSIGLMLLSALLCLSMLLASCAQSEPANETQPESTAPETTQIPETVYSIPEEVKVNYAEILAKWKQYLTFVDPGEREEYLTDYKKLFVDDDGYDEDKISVRYSGIFCFVTKTNTYLKQYPDMPDVEVKTGTTYTVYNIKTGDVIFEETVPYNEDITTNPSLSVNALSGIGGTVNVLSVYRRQYVASGEDEYGETIYSWETTYDYLDENGNAIRTGHNELLALSREADNTIRFELGGLIYTYAGNGEFICTFEKGQEKLFPKANYTGDDYYYVYIDRTFIAYDKDYNRLCEYNFTNSYDRLFAYYLNGGKVAFVYQADNNVTEYTTNLAQTFVILDVNTGKTTEFKKDFVIETFFCDNNLGTSGIDSNGDHYLAVIRMIEDGNAYGERKFVILDSDMNIIETLPTFVKAQNNVLGMIDESKLLISAYNAAGDEHYYTVNVNSGEVKLFIDASDSAYTSFNNGFIYKNKLYNNDCRELLDLESVDYDIYDEYMIINDSDGYSLCYIDNGYLVERSIISYNGTYSLYGDCILVEDYYDYGYYYEESTTGEGEETPAETTDDSGSSGSDSYYSDSSTYKIFNLKGDLLVEHYDRITILVNGNGFVFYKVVDEYYYADGYDYNEHYYILK